MRFDFSRIAIPCQCCKLHSGRAANHALERPSRHVCQLADGDDPLLGEPRLGRRTYPPHKLDRQIVEEIQLGRGINNQ
jgi:hypothetical protein